MDICTTFQRFCKQNHLIIYPAILFWPWYGLVGRVWKTQPKSWYLSTVGDLSCTIITKESVYQTSTDGTRSYIWQAQLAHLSSVQVMLSTIIPEASNTVTSIWSNSINCEQRCGGEFHCHKTKHMVKHTVNRVYTGIYIYIYIYIYYRLLWHIRYVDR